MVRQNLVRNKCETKICIRKNRRYEIVLIRSALNTSVFMWSVCDACRSDTEVFIQSCLYLQICSRLIIGFERYIIFSNGKCLAHRKVKSWAMSSKQKQESLLKTIDVQKEQLSRYESRLKGEYLPISVLNFCCMGVHFEN